MGFLLYYFLRFLLKREFHFWPEMERENHLFLQNECLNEQFKMDIWRIGSIWFGDIFFWRNVFCLKEEIVNGEESDFED
jgi:hypothetical protein